jgi:hypothetical protein
VPGRYVVGVVFDQVTTSVSGRPLSLQPTVRACDEAVSKLATSQRRGLSLGSQDPGGFETKKRISAGSEGAGKVHIERVASPGTSDRHDQAAAERMVAIEAACVAAIDTEDLHYVALCREGSLILTVDCLDHDDVSKFFTQISVRERRAFYATFNRDLSSLVSRFARVIAPTIGTRLLRVVLDVEQGAIYYFRLGRGVYLVGVTLDQARVLDADDKVSRLAIDCQALLRAAQRTGDN